MQGAEAHRRRNAERPDKGAATLGNLGRRLGGLAHDALPARQECQTVLGKRHLACRALHEPRAERALQFDEPLADHRFGQSQPPRGLADRPASATATNATIPSSFIIVRQSRSPVSAEGGYCSHCVGLTCCRVRGKMRPRSRRTPCIFSYGPFSEHWQASSLRSRPVAAARAAAAAIEEPLRRGQRHQASLSGRRRRATR